MVEPITPEQAKNSKHIPEGVIEVFNALISQNLRGKSSSVKQSDVLQKLIEKGFNREEIFKKNWLDVEQHYRRVGWNVVYDKPAYYECYDAFFTFSF